MSPEIEAMLAAIALGLLLGAAHILNVRFNTDLSNGG
jgi:hypothetical protein